MDLNNSVAIVTGAGGGIGRGIATQFARNGIAVVCTARRKVLLDETVRLIEQAGGRAIAVPCDVTDTTQVDHLVEQTLKAYGSIDIVFNNAASFNTIGGLWEVDPEQWWNDVVINIRGPMLLSHAVLPHMMKRDSGIIINMNGGGATSPLPGGSSYGCSKAALLRLTDTLARELERAGSRVMCVAMGPGFVRTEMTELQVNTEMGRKWLPSSKEAMDAGKTRSPEDCGRDTVELLKNLRPEFNGRIFSVGHDFQDLARRAEEIKQKDLYVMRSK